MSRHDGRILVAQINVDFAVHPLTNSGWYQALASLPADVVRADITNTATDTIQIGIGAPGVEKSALVVGQETVSQPFAFFANTLQSVSLQSTFDASLSSGRITIAFYN